jgi:hypothetical protein
VISSVYAYWSSLRDNGAVPKRLAIEAAALGAALPHIFLAEIISAQMAKIRICGHQIEALQGLDMRGMPVSALFRSSARHQLADALAHVALGARVTLSLRADGQMGQPQMTATLALLPLADSAGAITRVMGVLEQQGTIGQSPRRFDLATPTQMTTEHITTCSAKRVVLRVIQGGKA